MRRIITAAIFFALTLFTAMPADAFHHWHRWGWGGCGYGWGGYGYRGYGWGGYGLGYGLGYRGFGYGYPGFGYGGYGYPGFYGGYGGYGGYGLGGFGGFGYSGYASPYYAVGYSPSYYSSYAPYCSGYNCGIYGSGTTVTVGYPYGLYSSATVPRNVIVSSRPASSPIITSAPAVATTRPLTPAAVVSKAPATALVLQKFLGLKDISPVAVASVTTARTTSAVPAAKGLDDILARLSNVESRRKAERMITEGDELFRAQNFHSALQKYKLAGSTAPDVIEAYWRQGHALVATHNYDLATAAFKRAIARTEDLGRGGFRLSDIYGGAAMTKSQHLESLAEWAMSRSNSSDPYFLLGLFLNYDGQPARAEKFFQKASDLAGISGGHIAVFLAPAEDPTRGRPAATARPAMTVPLLPISTAVEL